MEKVNIGVTNPYAIAEMVAGKQIRWNSLSNPVAELSAILNISEKQIFAADSPLLRPGATTGTSGGLEILSPDKAQARLETHLKSNLQQATKENPLNRKVLTMADIHLLVSQLIAQKQGTNNQPWQPANTVWVDKGDFFEDLAEINDPIQGSIANCYFIAAMSSVAWSRPYAIANTVRPSAWGDDEGPIHRVVFYRNGAGNGEPVEVGECTPVAQGSQNWIYARSRDAAEIWPAVMEKAFAKWTTGNTTDFPDYGPMAFGDPVLACAQIVRGTRESRATSAHTANALNTFVRANSLGKRTFNPMVAWTYGSAPTGLDYGSARVVANHAYSILGWDFQNGTDYIVLRNPWGTHEATLDVLSGSWFSAGAYSANMPLNTGGTFAMKVSTFKQYFDALGWVV